VIVDKSLFEPLESKRSFEEVSSKIKALIFSGHLKPGDRLPSENELAKQYKVGRQTIREAFRILELSGFLTVQKGYGGGPVIQDNIMEKISDMILDAVRLDKLSVQEFTAARIAIEKAILNEAFDKIDEVDIKKLQENVSTAEDKIKKNESATVENFNFHTLLARASKNNIYIIMEGAINAIHRFLRRRYAFPYDKTKAGATVHGKILDAIIKRDRDKALDLLEKDLITVSGSLVPISEDFSSALLQQTTGNNVDKSKGWKKHPK
jgi:DNA-binding FadR family transcriptional regulator